MNNNVIISAVGYIDDSLLLEAINEKPKNTKRRFAVIIAAALLVLMIPVGIFAGEQIIEKKKNVFQQAHEDGIAFESLDEYDDIEYTPVTDDPAGNVHNDPDLGMAPQGWAVGGSGGCMVHSIGYHTFPSYLTEYVGEEVFNEWYEEVGEDYVYSTVDCPIKSSNLYEFIKHFNIPKEVVIDFYNSTTRYYYHNTIDIDLLYDGTAEENDQYYREVFNDYAERYRKSNFSGMKNTLIQRNQETLDAYLGTMAHGDNISMIEVIIAAGITREQMEENIKEANSYMPDVDLKIAYDYDLDLVYGQREYVEKLMKEHSPFYMDLLFCGLEPRETPY